MPSKIFVLNIAMIVIFVFKIDIIDGIASIVILFFARSDNHKKPGTLKF